MHVVHPTYTQATPRTMLGRHSTLWRGHLRDWSVLCVMHLLMTQYRPTVAERSTAHSASRSGRPEPYPAPPAEAQCSQIHLSMCSEIEKHTRISRAYLCTAQIGKMAATRRWIYLKSITTSHQTTAALSRLWTVATGADTKTCELL